jgi:hypothetical protein
MDFQQWFAAHRRRNPNAKINATTRDLYRAWLKNNPRDPGEGGPGAGRVPGLTPQTGQGAPPDTPPAQPTPQGPPPVVAPRIDAAQELGIGQLYTARNLLPRQYNSQRNKAATNSRAGLLDAGFFDNIDITSEEGARTGKSATFEDYDIDGQPGGQQGRRVVTADDPQYEGNIEYKFKYGPDGRLYRQAYMNTANSFASRGVYSSSLVGDTNRRNLQSMDASRDQSIRNYNNLVDQIGGNQATDDRNLTNQIDTGNVAYQASTAGADVTVPSTTPGQGSTDVSGQQTVTPPPATSTPPAGNLGSWQASAVGRNPIARITQRVRSNPANAGVSFRIVKRGNRYVAVRT